MTTRRSSRPETARSPWKMLLHHFATSPTTKLVTGLFLFVTALANLVEGVFFELHEVLDPAHALLALGILMVVQSLAEGLEAVEFLDRAEE